MMHVLDFEKDRFPPFMAVTLRNNDTKVLKIWKENNSEGYAAPTIFLKKSQTDREYLIRRRCIDWTVNKLDFFEIPPGEALHLNWNINDREWVIPVDLDLSSGPWLMRVRLKYEPFHEKIYFSDRVVDTAEWGVFAGEICSFWK